MTRKPSAEHYDVDIQLESGEDNITCFANSFVKFTYDIDPATRSLKPGKAVPLLHDLKDESQVPRMPAHSDYWRWKSCTDIAVVGSAHAPDGKPVVQQAVSVVIGKRRRDLLVFGKRFIEFRNRMPVIGEATPFTSQSLGIEHAYGGCDFRVPFDMNDPRAMGVTLEADHPGLYPRNPWGTGYLALDEPIEGMLLPTQEDPADRLNNDRLIAHSPEAWYEQPMPAHIGWVPVNCFPRNIFMAIECDPWFTPPQDEHLQEVKRGHLAKDYRTLLADQVFGTPPHWRFQQEAVPELIFKNDVHGAPVTLSGLHPEYPVIEFKLPASAPQLKMKIEDSIEDLQPLLTAVQISPDNHQVTMTYTATMQSPRPFIPGIHKKIPVALSVNGEKAVPYVAPATIKSLLAKAEASQEEKK